MIVVVSLDRHFGRERVFGILAMNFCCFSSKNMETSCGLYWTV